MGMHLPWYMATVFASVGFARGLDLPFDLGAALSFVIKNLKRVEIVKTAEIEHGLMWALERSTANSMESRASIHKNCIH